MLVAPVIDIGVGESGASRTSVFGCTACTRNGIRHDELNPRSGNGEGSEDQALMSSSSIQIASSSSPGSRCCKIAVESAIHCCALLSAGPEPKRWTIRWNKRVNAARNVEMGLNNAILRAALTSLSRVVDLITSCRSKPCTVATNVT